ncbi:hypothetical protein K438DRAFT_1994362 [Mycena galopus ATCC 62051]|nr:hypothetical protein K438DRAFT_1994362 [Mycena galopus ATCC 62051]
MQYPWSVHQVIMVRAFSLQYKTAPKAHITSLTLTAWTLSLLGSMDRGALHCTATTSTPSALAAWAGFGLSTVLIFSCPAPATRLRRPLFFLDGGANPNPENDMKFGA